MSADAAMEWVCVPIEPTPEMVSCCDSECPPFGTPEAIVKADYERRWYERKHIAMRIQYAAMLAAAPRPAPLNLETERVAFEATCCLLNFSRRVDDPNLYADFKAIHAWIGWQMRASMIDERIAAPPAPAADALDAARYRWLRDGGGQVVDGGGPTFIDVREYFGQVVEGVDLDATIDAAISAQAAAGEGKL